MNIDVSKGFDLGCFHYIVEDDEGTQKNLEERSRYGECSCTRCIIRVSTKHNPDHYHNTFLHEMVEAVDEVYGNGKMKHDEITNIANGMSQALKSMGIMFGGNDDKDN